MAENPIKYSDLFQDDGALDVLIKKIKELEDVYARLSKTIKDEIKGVKAETQKLTVVDDSQITQLKEKEKQIENLTQKLGELKAVDSELAKQKKAALAVANKEAELIKKRNELTEESAIKNAELRLEIEQLNKKNKEQAKINLGLVGAYEKESKALNELRKRYKDLAVEGKENTVEAKKLLLSITALDTKLKDLDKSVGQTQRNVGNYKDSVKEALQETNLFGEGLGNAIDKSGKLGAIIGKLSHVLSFMKKLYAETTVTQKASAAATEAQTLATETQVIATQEAVVSQEELALTTTIATEATDDSSVALAENEVATTQATLAQRLFAKANLSSVTAVKLFWTTLKSTGIVIVITALAGLVAMLSKTKAGLDGVSVFLAGLGARFQVFIGRLATFGSGIFNIGKSIVGVFAAIGQAATGNFEKAGQTFTKVSKDMSAGINEVTGAFDGMGAAMDKAAESAENLERQQIAFKLQTQEILDQIAALNRVAELNAQIEADSTRSFKDRREAIIANRKAIIEADALNDKILQNEVDRQTELKRLRDESGIYDPDADIEYKEAKRALYEDETGDLIDLANYKTALRELEEEEIMNNLDILNNAFIARKKINELIIKSDKEAFDLRQQTIQTTKALQEQALRDEVAEIQKTVKAKIDINELLAITDTKILQERIRGFGLSSTLEKELLKAIKINLDAINDLAVEETELFNKRSEFLKKIEIETEAFIVSTMHNYEQQERKREELRFARVQKELEDEYKLAGQKGDLIEALNKKEQELEKIHQENLKKIEVDALILTNDQKEKMLETDMLNTGVKEKKLNEVLRDARIKALEEEIAKKKELNKENQQFNKELIDDELALARMKSDKEKEIEKERLSEIKHMRDLIAEASFKAFEDRLNKEQALLDEQAQKQQDNINKQQQLAMQGAENTLAFEEGQLAKLEQKKIEAQKKANQLKKIEALYSAYSSAASSGDENAVVKVIRDFAIMQGIESSLQAFGDGTGEYGSIGDAIDAKQGGSKGGNSLRKGIFSGEKHQTKGRGIPVLVEGGEGILSVNQMNALGKDNFMHLTKSLDSGMLSSDVFGGQVAMIPQRQTMVVDFSSLKAEINDVKKAIENKPVQQVNVENLRDSYLDIVETNIVANKRNISRYRVNKSRL